VLAFPYISDRMVCYEELCVVQVIRGGRRCGGRVAAVVADCTMVGWHGVGR